MEIEFILLIVIAILEVVDGQGIALRILRLLSNLIGGQTNDEQQNIVKEIQGKTTRQNQKVSSP